MHISKWQWSIPQSFKSLQSASLQEEKIVDWLIDYLRFYVPLKNFSLIWRRHHCRWRAAKFRLMLGAQGLWAGRDLYRATLAVTRGLGFSGLIRRTAPFSRLLRHTRGCGGSILTQILWILLSWQYAHLLMIMKHCTKFQVSTVSCLGGEMSTRFCDRQTDGLTDQQKVQKWMGGDIISIVAMRQITLSSLNLWPK
jgi:hypothetical protein